MDYKVLRRGKHLVYLVKSEREKSTTDESVEWKLNHQEVGSQWPGFLYIFFHQCNHTS